MAAEKKRRTKKEEVTEKAQNNEPEVVDYDKDATQDEGTADLEAIEISDEEEIDALNGEDDLDNFEDILNEDGNEFDRTASSALVSVSDTLPAPYDPLRIYLQEAGKYPLLSREEEKELARRYQEEGDLKAAEKMVTSNLRLVVKISMDYRRYWTNLLDLIQEGNIGLMQAVKNYDPTKNVKLSYYASFWIKAYILKFIIDNWSLVKVGTTQAQRKLFFHLKKQKEHYSALLGYEPTNEMLAEDLNVKPEEVEEMNQRLAAGDLSLNQPVATDSDETHLDFLADRSEAVDEKLADDEIRMLFHNKLEDFEATLADKELFILKNRLLSENPTTLREIGDMFGVSRERVRQMEERLIIKMKTFFEENVPGFSDISISTELD